MGKFRRPMKRCMAMPGRRRPSRLIRAMVSPWFLLAASDGDHDEWRLAPHLGRVSSNQMGEKLNSSMVRGWFITGTDTGVGKTRIACLLLEALAREGRCAVGMKPVASGCRETAAGLRNQDAERLLAVSGVAVDYAEVNPYALGSACAPHIAAHEMGIEIELEKILGSFRRLQQKSPWGVGEGEIGR